MAVITKLLEGTLAVGQTTISFTDSDIPNSFIRIGCTNDDLFPSDIRISSNTLTITYDAQSSALGVIVELVKDDLSVIDSLESESQTDALSANQGYVLKGLIDNIQLETSLSDLTDVSITEPAAGDILTYDSVNETWDNIPMPSIPFELDDLSDVDLTSPTSGEGLIYNGSDWINGSLSAAVVYSEIERGIGQWLDGSTLYEKTVDFGALPNSTTKSLDHNIRNLSKIVDISGTATNGSDTLPVPYINSNQLSSSVQIIVTSTQISIRTAANLSSYTDTYITLRYIKSS